MDRVKIRDPNRLTEAELAAIAQVVIDEDSEEELREESDLSEDEVVEESDHNTNSEEEMSDADDLATKSTESDEKLVGKDKQTVWNKTEIVSKRYKTSSKNIIKIVPRANRSALDISIELDSFMKFFTEEMIEQVVQCTNLQIAKVRPKYTRERDAKDTTRAELLAFIGLLFLSGCKKQSHTHFLELWTNDGTGSQIYRACMSYQRFLFLLAAIRFDDKNTIHERKNTDKLAAIRFILDNFVDNCKKHYTVGEYLTIDEMLIAFRGRCSFIQYIPSKPAKYGLKAFVLCDAKTFYVSNLEIYCGKHPEGKYNLSNTPTAIVHRLLENLKGSKRNLTCDNWYSSYPLAKELLHHNITMIGTMKKNKRELPLEFMPNKNRQVGSSIFNFQEDTTIVSYVPKKGKSVILISTLHDDSTIDPESNKPEIILDYNATKGDVDTVDKMCNTYSVNRRTRRWPLVIFYQLMNIAGINSQILYNATNIVSAQKHRRIYLKNLVLSLLKQHLTERAAVESLPTDIKHFLAKYKTSEEDADGEPPQKIRARCFLCGRKKNRITTIVCNNCQRSVCKEHMENFITCNECKNIDDDSIE